MNFQTKKICNFVAFPRNEGYPKEVLEGFPKGHATRKINSLNLSCLKTG